MATSTDEKWHLDKRVPVAIVVTVLLQAGTGLWFAAKLDARVTALEEAKTLQRERDALQDQAMGQTATLIRADLSYIRGQLDQLLRDQRVEAKPPR